MPNPNKVKSEQRFKKIVESKSAAPVDEIVSAGFRFEKPNYWDDQLVLILVIKALKVFCCIAVLIVLGINLSVIVVNDKKMNWDLFTYDHSGEIRWTRAHKMQ
ncbi:hypothetical protein KW429_11200 [Vibrio fluvialis]|nr:hypothetical protein [Vibrio fluvialis]MBY7902419.1 hypothetical protein [Vibrio fluvialis]